MPPNVAVRKSDIFGDDWSSVDDLYEDERKQWVKDNPEPTPTPTMDDSWQTRLPNFDPSMDDPIWGPTVAMRVQGDYPAGSPVRQGAANLGYEEMLDIHSEHPKKDKTQPDDDDPTWDPDVESEWERDPESGSRYYYDSSGQKVFLDLEEGMKGSWLARPTRKDASNLYAHTGDPRKLVFVRQNALLGTQMKRDSDQNPEGVAEMFLQHDENLPKEGLVSIPLRGRSYQHAAAGLGLPDHTKGLHSQSHHGVGYSWSNPSRWSDALLPWQKPEEEGEDWHKVMQGEPMDIAFQLLKGDDYPYHPSIQAHRERGYTDQPIGSEHWLEGTRNTEKMPPGGVYNITSREPSEIPYGSSVEWDSTRHRMLPNDLAAVNFDYRPIDYTWPERNPVFPPPGTGKLMISEEEKELDKHNRGHQNSIENRRERAQQTIRDLRWMGTPYQRELSPDWKRIHGISDKEYRELVRWGRKGEPMDIAFQLLKDRKSPEAWANKRRYDSQYEKNPKRVKYREQLNTERRRRGIYGKGGSDVSHTQGGKLTLEKPSSNRARHFKGKGTLRRVKVK